MIVWFALLIPAVTAAVLYWRFQARIALWELAVLALVPAGFVVGGKALVDYGMTTDTEFWGGWVTRAEHYEDWNELVTYTETYTDADGNVHTQVKTRVDYHPAYWRILDSNGGSQRIQSSQFTALAKRFGNKKFVDLHRGYHSNDGDKYVTSFPGGDKARETVTTVHRYENRVAVSDSVFNFPEVNPKDFGLYEYPEIRGHQQDCLQGWGKVNAHRALALLNAKLGRKKQVRAHVLVFRGQPLQAGVDQESYWKGGNKNEFVTCVGIDKAGAVSWAYVFSWSEAETLKVEARNFLVGQESLDLEAYFGWLHVELDRRFVRKPFADFSYLTVSPPGWAIFLVYLLTLLVCGGLGAFVVLNDIDGDGRSRRSKQRRVRWGRRRF